MKTKQFFVPVEIMVEFAELLSEYELANEITGTSDDEEIIVEVDYETEERQAIYSLQDIIEDFHEGQDDED